MSERTFGYASADLEPVGDVVGRRGRLRIVADAAVTYGTDAPHAPDGRDVREDGRVDPAVALAALRRAADLVAAADLDVGTTGGCWNTPSRWTSRSPGCRPSVCVP